jgi:hypothetical protein
MSVEAKYIVGWVIKYDSFSKWCVSKNIDMDEYLSDPDTYKDGIPSYIDIQLVCPYPNAPLNDYECSFHLNYCTGSLETIRTLPALLLYGAKEFVHSVQPNSGEAKCQAILHYR